MTRISILVASLLLIGLADVAAAADVPEHNSPNAQKLLATLNMVGINNQDVQQFINNADSRVEHGYLYMAEGDAMGGKLSLRYELGGGVGSRQMELRYAPDDSHMQVTVRTNIALVGLHYEFR